VTDEELEESRNQFMETHRQAQGTAAAFANPPSHYHAELDRLASLSPVEYGLERIGVAERIGIAVRLLDEEIADRKRKLFPHTSEGIGQRLALPEIQPADDPVDGSALLSNLTGKLSAHVVLPTHAPLAIALWIIRAYLDDVFDTSPRLALTSPEKRCGKTTLLEILAKLVPRPLATSNVAPAVLFRTIEGAHPTLLIDEVDSFADAHEELRGILNSGHRREAARVIRCVGDDHEPRAFSTWCPMVLAAIGKLPDTVVDRSVSVPMRRKAPGEKAQRVTWSGRKGRTIRDHLHTLARGCARWAQDHREKLYDVEPHIPETLNDRQRDNWTPLLAIAEAIGGDWPARVREAAVALSGGEEHDTSSAGVQLLADVREFFTSKQCDRIGSQTLCDELAQLEERPWSAWRHGKPLTPNQLARLLRPYKVESRTIREAGTTFKGYYLDLFGDAFSRYLTPLDISSDQEHPLLNRHTVTSSAQSGDESLFRNVTEEACDVSENGTNPAPMATCDGVTLLNAISVDGEHIQEVDL
jgi:putative DNA primase/helicase